MESERWALIAPHHRRLVRMARRRVPTLQDAEDCAQEALVRCARVSDLDETRVAPLLSAITKRVCADWHRRAARERRAVVRCAHPPSHAGGIPEAELALDRPWFAATLHTLSPTERSVLLARAAGRSTLEIAASENLSCAAVASALTRARKKMSAALVAPPGERVRGSRGPTAREESRGSFDSDRGPERKHLCDDEPAFAARASALPAGGSGTRGSGVDDVAPGRGDRSGGTDVPAAVSGPASPIEGTTTC